MSGQSDSGSSNIVGLLREALGGGQTEIEAAFRAVEPDLRRLVRAKRYYRNRAERTTGLVDIVFLEFLNHKMQTLRDRRQFFTWAARVIITTLAALRRYEDAYKRAPLLAEPFDDLWRHLGSIPDYDTALLLEQAYEAMLGSEPECAAIFERKFVFGQQNTEIAEELYISLATVERRVKFIRAHYRKFFGTDP